MKPKQKFVAAYAEVIQRTYQKYVFNKSLTLAEAKKAILEGDYYDILDEDAQEVREVLSVEPYDDEDEDEG